MLQSALLPGPFTFSGHFLFSTSTSPDDTPFFLFFASSVKEEGGDCQSSYDRVLGGVKFARSS